MSDIREILARIISNGVGYSLTEDDVRNAKQAMGLVGKVHLHQDGSHCDWPECPKPRYRGRPFVALQATSVESESKYVPDEVCVECGTDREEAIAYHYADHGGPYCGYCGSEEGWKKPTPIDADAESA